MSRVHNVIVDDRLTNISIKYYGTASKTGLIVSGNPQLNGRPISLEGLPTIYPGDIIIIPDETTNIVNFPEKKLFPDTIPDIQPDAITFLINGEQFNYFSEYNLTQVFDSFDNISFSVPLDETNELIDIDFEAFSYQDIGVYYAGNLIFGGTVLAPVRSSGPGAKVLTVASYPKCGVLNDVVTPDSLYPIEFENQNLQQISNKLLEPFGLQSVFLETSGNFFKRVMPGIEQKILVFLIELAKQRGFYTTNTPQGNLLFWKADIDSEPVANIKEGESPFISCVPNFNPQKYYSHITGFLPVTKDKDSEKYTWVNPFLQNKGILRPDAFVLQDSEASDLRSAVELRAGRMFAAQCGYTLTVEGHRDQEGNLYTKNTNINVLALGADIKKDTMFSIRSLNLIRTSNDGDRAAMNLVLPGAYAGQIPEVVPWEL